MLREGGKRPWTISVVPRLPSPAPNSLYIRISHRQPRYPGTQAQVPRLPSPAPNGLYIKRLFCFGATIRMFKTSIQKASASVHPTFVRCVLLRASRSPSAAVLWLSNRLHSCIIAMPLPEKALVFSSVLTQLSPVARNTPSSQAENHIVRFAQKMNRRILCRARWTRVLFVASGALSALAMRRIPAMKGCMTGPSASCALERYFVM